MIERDFRNNIQWEEPDGAVLEVSRRADFFDQEQIHNLFDVEFSGEISEEDGVFLSNASVTIFAKSDVEFTAEISLLVEGEPPYSIFRNGTQIDTELDNSDFPYTDTTTQTGYTTYRVEDDDENFDETTVFIESLNIPLG